MPKNEMPSAVDESVDPSVQARANPSDDPTPEEQKQIDAENKRKEEIKNKEAADSKELTDTPDVAEKETIVSDVVGDKPLEKAPKQLVEANVSEASTSETPVLTEEQKQAAKLTDLKAEMAVAKTSEAIAEITAKGESLNEDNLTKLNEYAAESVAKIQDSKDMEGISEMLGDTKYAGMALAAKKWIMNLFPESFQSAISSFWNDTVDTFSSKNIAAQLERVKTMIGNPKKAFGFDVDMESDSFMKGIKNFRKYLGQIDGVDKNDPAVLAYAFSGETEDAALESKMGDVVEKITKIKEQPGADQDSFLAAIADPKKAFANQA